MCPASFSVNETMPMRQNEIINEETTSVGPMSEDMVRAFVLAIERILDKKLLGVDLIVDADNPSRVHCIDINLFPSYTGFPNVSKVMGQFIADTIAK